MKPTAFDRPDPGPDFTSLIEARDLWDVYSPKLTAKQRSAIEASIFNGVSVEQIAAIENVHVRKIHERISRGLQRLRELTSVIDA